LKTLPITSFTSAVTFASHVAPGIDLSGQYDLDTNPNLVGINNEQMTLSTYSLQVVVSDAAAHVATGAVTVVSANSVPAQPGLAVGVRQYLTAAPMAGTNATTYAWSLVQSPDGSAVVVENSATRNASIRPDKEGDYILQLTTKAGSSSTSTYVTVTGATYVGVATCASCHGTSPQVGLTDIYTPWSQTEHATMAQRGVDGLLSPEYNESCFVCHTLGYNQSPLATNGNFYAVQQQIGWKFPTVLQVGNYATMPAKLQNLANIQCENCHGPGSQHPGPASISLDVAVCAQCHQDGDFHNRPSQWSLGPHGADDGYLSISIDEAPNASCTKCHSPQGFVQWQEGQTPISTEAGRLTCAGCHDPHNVKMFPETAHQVRVYDTVMIDSIDINTGTNVVLTGQGPSAVCMQCHNARRGPFQINNGLAYYLGGTPHESTATDVLLGLNACTNIVVAVVTNGMTNVTQVASVVLQNSAHTGVAKCIDCHMYPDNNPARLSGVANIAACNQCHAGVDPVTAAEGFDHVSVITGGRGNYDGSSNGVAGVQTEVAGVMTNLYNKMIATGLVYTGAGGSPWSGFAGNANPVKNALQRAAVWNYQLITNERSMGVHNTAYTVGLLQWMYTALSTNTGGNAYTVDFPLADLRYNP